MKYLKTFETKEKIRLSINVSLFPNHEGLKENEEPTTGTWTTFFGYSHIKEIGHKISDILFRKYFGTDDPCKDSQYGPCRPEYETYPQELANLLIFIGEYARLSEKEDEERTLERSKKKKYWRYSNVPAPIDDNEEVELVLYFSSKKDALDWLDLFEFVLNNPEKRDMIEDFMAAKKYNL